MKKIFISFLFGWCFFGCSNFKQVDLFPEEKFEFGKCYHSFLIPNQESNSNFEEAFILEIEQPVFNKIEITYSAKEIDRFLNDKDEFFIETKKAGHYFIFKNDDLHDYTRDKNFLGFMFCKVEVPSEFRFFQKKDLLNYKNGVTVNFKKLVQPSQLKKKYVKRKPKHLNDNQLYFPKGSWTELRVAERGTSCPVVPFIRGVQIKLRNLGYDVDVNNEIDEKTKTALINFQQKNGLKTGQLDLETLKALGLEY